MSISWIKLVQKRCRNTDKHASALLSLQIDFFGFLCSGTGSTSKNFGALSIEKHISVENRFIFDYWKTIFQSDCLHHFLSYQFNCLRSMFEKENNSNLLWNQTRYQKFHLMLYFLFIYYFFVISRFSFFQQNARIRDWGTHAEISTHKMDRYRLSKLIIHINLELGKLFEMYCGVTVIILLKNIHIKSVSIAYVVVRI